MESGGERVMKIGGERWQRDFWQVGGGSGVGERIEKGCWVAGDSGVSGEVVRVREGCCREEKC